MVNAKSLANLEKGRATRLCGDRETCRKAGKRSAQVRREKRRARQMLEQIIGHEPPMTIELRQRLEAMGIDPETESVTLGFLSVLALVVQAMQGNVRALELMLEIRGESPKLETLKRQQELEMKRLEVQKRGFAALDAAIDSMMGTGEQQAIIKEKNGDAERLYDE